MKTIGSLHHWCQAPLALATLGPNYIMMLPLSTANRKEGLNFNFIYVRLFLVCLTTQSASPHSPNDAHIHTLVAEVWKAQIANKGLYTLMYLFNGTLSFPYRGYQPRCHLLLRNYNHSQTDRTAIGNDLRFSTFFKYKSPHRLQEPVIELLTS